MPLLLSPDIYVLNYLVTGIRHHVFGNVTSSLPTKCVNIPSQLFTALVHVIEVASLDV
jgi:hypothetical protein